MKKKKSQERKYETMVATKTASREKNGILLLNIKRQWLKIKRTHTVVLHTYSMQFYFC